MHPPGYECWATMRSSVVIRLQTSGRWWSSFMGYGSSEILEGLLCTTRTNLERSILQLVFWMLSFFEVQTGYARDRRVSLDFLIFCRNWGETQPSCASSVYWDISRSTHSLPSSHFIQFCSWTGVSVAHLTNRLPSLDSLISARISQAEALSRCSWK